MNLLVFVGLVNCSYGLFLVERHLTHTVDGVVGVIHNLRHTVLCSLHHHTATKDTAEVCTLNGVHQTTGIDRNDTVLFPIEFVRIFLARCRISKKNIDISDLDTFKHSQQVVDCQCRSLSMFAALWIVGCSVLIRTLLDTLILQLIIICFAVRKQVILFNGDFWRQAIIVRTVVGNIKSTIAIDKSQVTVAIQTTRATCAQRNQVTVIDIMD